MELEADQLPQNTSQLTVVLGNSHNDVVRPDVGVYMCGVGMYMCGVSVWCGCVRVVWVCDITLHDATFFIGAHI